MWQANEGLHIVNKRAELAQLSKAKDCLHEKEMIVYQENEMKGRKGKRTVVVDNPKPIESVNMSRGHLNNENRLF